MLKLISAAAVLAMASGASATILYQTSFEAPTFNLTLNGVDGWITQGGGAITNNAANARTGSRYVSVTPTTSGQWQWQGTIAQSAASLAVNPIIRASVWAQIFNGTTTTNLKRAGLQMYNVAATGVMAAMYIDSDGTLTVTDEAGNQFASGAGFVNSSIYNQMQIELNYANSTARYFLNGVDLGVVGTIFSTDFGDADFYSTRTTGTAGGNQIRYDDYLVEQVPTPGTLALMGLGGLVAARRRRA
ncbi:MAG: PEP-CTERM sorting domain-containing protein [Phycisphaeraceae bacterium]|nr:PEP-CTERM sorting domain-containing protein [Phycisphaeraceae bacterium]